MAAAMDPQVGCGLVQLPLEVLIRITYFIPTKDLGSVRLSCRALEEGLFSFFSHEFFRKKQFMVSTDSLQALIDISKHPTLSPFLKHVIICADRPSHTKWVQDRNDEARALLEIANADHMHLLATGGLRDMLAEAFARLKNLETVDIRDFESRSRNRDGFGAHWRSYGAVTMAASTAAPVQLGPRGDQDPYPSQLFGAVTAALAAASARPKSIEVLLRSGNWHPFALYDTAFYIPPRMEASMSSLLAGLKTLHLALTFSHTSRIRPFIFQKFLSLAPNLTWLRLNFNHTHKVDCDEVLSWLALNDNNQTPQASFDMGPIQLRHLERLDLGDAETESKTLLKLVAKFAPTLTSLYLRRVNLYEADSRVKDPKVTPWVGFLSVMAKMPGLRLRVLDLSSIQHSGTGWSGQVVFKSPNKGGPLRNWTCSANTVTMDKAVAQASEALDPKWPLDEPDPMSGKEGTFLYFFQRGSLTAYAEDEDEENEDDEDDDNDDGEANSDDE